MPFYFPKNKRHRYWIGKGAYSGHSRGVQPIALKEFGRIVGFVCQKSNKRQARPVRDGLSNSESNAVGRFLDNCRLC